MTDREALAVRVAERVWKWKSQLKGAKGKDWFHQYIDPDGVSHIVTDDSPLEHEVFSWEGLGRTLEAMAERGFLFGPEAVGFDYRDELAFADVQKSEVYPIIWPPNKPLELIEAVQTAALEALKARHDG